MCKRTIRVEFEMLSRVSSFRSSCVAAGCLSLQLTLRTFRRGTYEQIQYFPAGGGGRIHMSV